MGASPASRPTRHSDSKASGSPGCGVAVSSTTRRERRASQFTAAARSGATADRWASSTTSRSHRMCAIPCSTIGLLHEVDRGDRQGQPVPRRGFRPRAPELVAKHREIDDRRPQSEAIREFALPLPAQSSRAQHESAGSSRCAHEGRRGSARPAPSFPARLRRRSRGAGRRAPMRAPVRPGSPSGPVARLPLPAGRRQPCRTPGAPAAPAPTGAGRRESTAVRGESGAGGRTAGAARE